MSKITRVYDVELRSKNEESREVEGYAVVFNASTDLGWFTEEIDSRAFDNTDMSNVYLLFNHDENNVLAGTLNNSLKMSINETGLFQSSEIINTSLGEDVLKLVKNGLINKMSFAFSIREGGEEWVERNGKEHRIIRDIDKLYDVSLVTYPAYAQTSAYARSNQVDELAEEHKRRKEQDLKMERILSNGKNA
jgi:hypothetical protein